MCTEHHRVSNYLRRLRIHPARLFTGRRSVPGSTAILLPPCYHRITGQRVRIRHAKRAFRASLCRRRRSSQSNDVRDPSGHDTEIVAEKSGPPEIYQPSYTADLASLTSVLEVTGDHGR